MQNTYIVRTKDKKLLCFHYNNDSIYCRQYSDGKWSKDTSVIENVRDSYTVNLTDDGQIYIFAQDKNGNIILCTKDNGFWKEQIILKSSEKNVKNIMFFSISGNQGMKLLYNIPQNDKLSHCLAMQLADKNGKWGGSQIIDNIVSLPESIFQLQSINKGHCIVFCQKRNKENIIGYRELTLSRKGDFNAVFSTNFNITDHCFLAGENGIYFVVAVKSMFSTQLIFRKTTDKGLSEPYVLWEGQKTGGCQILFVKGVLYIFFLHLGRLYYCISNDFGDSFSKPERYKEHFCSIYKKAYFISYDKMSEKEFLAREFYVESKNVSNIQIISDLYDSFYNESVNKMSVVVEKEDSQEIIKLNNRISELNSKLDEKNRQIIQLTDLLNKKNEEIVWTENNWKNKLKNAVNVNEKEKQTNDIKQKNIEIEKKEIEKRTKDKTKDNIEKDKPSYKKVDIDNVEKSEEGADYEDIK